MTDRLVITQPKPERRSAKARKPLPRVHVGGKRSRVPEALAKHRSWEREADRLWSRIVRSLRIMCCRCGCRPVADPHHLISRRYRQTRWLVDNGAPLCKGCHMWVQADGEENRALALRLIGAERWEQLQTAKRCGAKVPC